MKKYRYPEYQKKWEIANKDRMRVYRRKWAIKNREKRRIQQKKWAIKNKDKVLISRKKHNSSNKRKEYNKRWVKNNKEKIKKALKKYRESDKGKNYKKNWLIKNKEKSKKYQKRYKQSDKGKKKTKEYVEKNRNKLNKYHRSKKIKDHLYAYLKNKKKIDPQFKISTLLRSRLRHALKNKTKTGSAVHDLGCTISELKSYLEKQFEGGMTWENHGRHGWHIDHIKPLSSFDLTSREELLKAVHYTNLQPLWWRDNLLKGHKIMS